MMILEEYSVSVSIRGVFTREGEKRPVLLP